MSVLKSNPNQSGPLYIDPAYLHQLRPHAAVGTDFPTAGMLERDRMTTANRVAVITVDDVLVPRGGFWWGIPMDALGTLIKKLAADPSVSAIVLDIDSPGGSVFGMQELNDAILEARTKTPIHGVANPLAASGALWLLSTCTKRFVSPSGNVGSHGVRYEQWDYSGQLEEFNIKREVFTSSPRKNEFDNLAPISEEARARLQQVVDYYHAKFTTALAKNYGLSKQRIEKDFGQGRVLLAEEAKAVGMVDGIATIEEVISKLANRGGGSRSGGRAEVSNKNRRRRLDLNDRT